MHWSTKGGRVMLSTSGKWFCLIQNSSDWQMGALSSLVSNCVYPQISLQSTLSLQHRQQYNPWNSMTLNAAAFWGSRARGVLGCAPHCCYGLHLQCLPKLPVFRGGSFGRWLNNGINLQMSSELNMSLGDGACMFPCSQWVTENITYRGICLPQLLLFLCASWPLWHEKLYSARPFHNAISASQPSNYDWKY